LCCAEFSTADGAVHHAADKWARIYDALAQVVLDITDRDILRPGQG
jgi:hypothetical protein